MYAMVPQQQAQQQVTQQQQQEQLQYQQRLNQQNLMQQAMLQQQQPMYHPGLLTAMSQIEPIPSGNLPPGFDATSCRSVYVGNIHTKVTEGLLAEVFASAGPLEGCKLIRKEKSSYGFVDYFDHRSAAAALLTLNGRQMFGQAIKVNWAYASGQREDTTGHFNIFVGDLSPEVTDATLFAAFSVYSSCSDARVMWDQRSGRSRGFGFVSFRSQQEAESAISEMTGKWLGSRPIRCNWAIKTNMGSATEDSNNSNGTVIGGGVDPAMLSSPQPVQKQEVHQQDEQHQEESQGDAPENNPQYTTVYVGNLAHEVTQAELHRQFHSLQAGIIEDVRVQRDKGFGFVRYRSHEEAAYAIQAANGRVICGKSVKCSWGSKPTPPGTSSSPLPPPPPMGPFQGVIAQTGMNQGYTTADLLTYQRQLGMAQAGPGRALLPLPHQQGLGLGLAQAPLGATANRAVYDGFQASAALQAGQMAQQRMYY
ncbi:nucleolysin TIA-1/TIAR [Marchantia polymorpha subsp. ruderalis]|uniref:RRM domain-containing protein n=6 Tax=Marchantia polymorpha TaxID=3197 RepID=A0A176WDG9_MARPO|nr:hypothetical protein AXG93_2018s1210 [Marchantia polymorpha subsp. ruderalis]PTQ45709.1 hypothetical protein MARPO_0014s0204 [Marchantia polymorpha]BBM98017.1 hypothetical protein Mp_1g10220 [Marchantia polymorpha subsp. ruderalis]|eukprot:PTQ45709.1 hypothetical protein MARPO_0014s0204 [Marchantia polymorpha]